MFVAGIDTGSNAIRMVIGKCIRGQSPQVIEVVRIPIRLGKDVFASGSIKRKTASDLIQAFRRFRKIMDFYGVIQHKAVATSAFREARNASDLINRIFISSQIKVEVIDGQEEARLVLMAISRFFGSRKLDALIIDIGGGSVETILSRKGKVTVIDSLRMGTVRLIKDYSPDRDFEQMRRRIRQVVRGFIRRHGFSETKLSEILIVTGGNARCLGRLAFQFLGIRTHLRMSFSELEMLISLLQSMSTKSRQEELGLKPDRADVILPAAIILYEFMIGFGYGSVEMPAVGLKDGVLCDLKSWPQ